MSAISRTSKRGGLAAILLTAWIGAQPALARPARPPQGKEAPCAVLLKYGGQIQILDSSRRSLLDTAPRAGIGCGSWLSVGSGWALIKHRDGHYIHAGSDTFIQFTEPNLDGSNAGDHLVLYKGQIHADIGSGSGELKVLTANARSRHGSGKALLIFSQEDEETQLIGLAGKATLENRFQGKRRIAVKAGEATSLNFKAMRVVPSTPRAVAVSSLKARLADLHISEKESRGAIEAAAGRQERKLASTLSEPEGDTARSRRAPASARAHYERHKAEPGDERLKEHWVNRLVDGAAEGRAMLFPAAKRKPAGEQSTLDMEEQRARGEAQAEKSRLLQELSKVRGE